MNRFRIWIEDAEITLADLILYPMALLFGAIGYYTGYTGPSIPKVDWEWKLGIYLPSFITILGLLAVFLVFYHDWKDKRLQELNRMGGSHRSEASADELLALLMVGLEMRKEGDDSLKDYLGYKPSKKVLEPAKKIKKDVKRDIRLSRISGNVEQECVFVFVIIVVLTLWLILETGSNLNQPDIISDKVKLGVLGIVELLSLYAFGLLGIFLFRFGRAIPRNYRLPFAISDGSKKIAETYIEKVKADSIQNEDDGKVTKREKLRRKFGK